MPRTLSLFVLALALTLHAPAATQAQQGSTPRRDRFGDPLPVGVRTRLGTLRFHRCSHAAYSPDGKVIAAVDGDDVSLWDVATSRIIRRLPLDDRHSAVGLIFSHDGKKLAAIGWGGTSIRVWDLETLKKIDLAQAKGGSGGRDWSSAAAFSSDDRTLFAGTSTKLFAWDVASAKKLAESPLRVGDTPIYARLLTFSPDGQTLLTTSFNSPVYVWEVATGRVARRLEAATYLFAPDNRLLAPGSPDSPARCGRKTANPFGGGRAPRPCRSGSGADWHEASPSIAGEARAGGGDESAHPGGG